MHQQRINIITSLQPHLSLLRRIAQETCFVYNLTLEYFLYIYEIIFSRLLSARLLHC